jgi:nucleotide-binding universal stress UspA family protein
MIKDLVINLAGAAGSGFDAASRYGLSVAEAFRAHVFGIAFAYEPVVAPSVMGGVPPEIIEEQRSEGENAASALIAKFQESARLAGLSAESRMIPTSFAGAADLFGQIARRFDLSVVRQAEPDAVAPQGLIIEAALFQSGRPVLVVPYIHKERLALDRVLVCWDASRNAARAIADAMPFLQRSKSVDVVVVATERQKSDELPGADIALHLARHDLNVDLKRIVSDRTDVASTILSYAADAGADFIVMGGYGHSRFREFILGGATRGILSAMTVPTLISH